MTFPEMTRNKGESDEAFKNRVIEKLPRGWTYTAENIGNLSGDDLDKYVSGLTERESIDRDDCTLCCIGNEGYDPENNAPVCWCSCHNKRN